MWPSGGVGVISVNVALRGCWCNECECGPQGVLV